LVRYAGVTSRQLRSETLCHDVTANGRLHHVAATRTIQSISGERMSRFSRGTRDATNIYMHCKRGPLTNLLMQATLANPAIIAEDSRIPCRSDDQIDHLCSAEVLSQSSRSRSHTGDFLVLFTELSSGFDFNPFSRACTIDPRAYLESSADLCLRNSRKLRDVWSALRRLVQLLLRVSPV